VVSPVLCYLSLGAHETFGTELEEDGIRIALTVVDTPGFGDNINNEAA
jgi:cell division control protein 11